MPFIENCSLMDVKTGYHYDAGENSVLIQIVDPDVDFPEPKYQFREVHRFRFLDIEDGDEGVEKFGITKEQASTISSVLVSALEKRSNVLVHCHAGICRSGAVAEVGVMLGFQDAEKYRSPNLRVKSMLLSELGLRASVSSSQPDRNTVTTHEVENAS